MALVRKTQIFVPDSASGGNSYGSGSNLFLLSLSQLVTFSLQVVKEMDLEMVFVLDLLQLDRLILQEKTQISIKTKITLKVDVTSCQSPLW